MISVEGLTYIYPGAGQPVLKNISFDIAEGEIFGFLGAFAHNKVMGMAISKGFGMDTVS